MSDEIRIGLTTCDNEDVAERLALGLIDRGLAACVKIDPNVRSMYRWKGELQDHSEVRLTITFAAHNAKAIESFILANHACELPEWVVLRPDHVCFKYEAWVTA